MPINHTVLSADHAPARTPSQLVPCVYVALRCRHCGELRQALASAPLSENVDCPVCSASCSFLLLGRGVTSASLPFHELYPRELTRWITQAPTNDHPNSDEIDVLGTDTLNPNACGTAAHPPAVHSEEVRSEEVRSEDARNTESDEPQALDGS